MRRIAAVMLAVVHVVLQYIKTDIKMSVLVISFEVYDRPTKIDQSCGIINPSCHAHQ